jgi:branched-chain amino acid transport system substrate-binding protein
VKQNNHPSRRTLLGAMLGAGATPLLAAPRVAPPREVIVLGQTLAIGAGSDGTAARIMSGANACVGAINAAGGVNGRLIELVTLDGGRDPESHARNVRELAVERGAVAVLNCAGDAICRSVAVASRQARLPLVGPLSSLQELRRSRDRMFFPVRASNEKQAEMLNRQLLSMGVSRAVLLTDQPLRSERLEILKPLLDASRIATTLLRVHPDQPATFEAALKTMGAASFHAAVLDLQPETIDKMSERGATDRAEWPRTLTAFATLGLVGLSGAFPGRVIGFANVVPHPEAIGLPITQDLHRSAEKYGTGYAINFEGMEAFINTRVCIEALRRIPGRPDAAKLVESLEKLDRVDLGGFVVSFAGGRETGSDWVEVGVRSRSGHYLK